MVFSLLKLFNESCNFELKSAFGADGGGINYAHLSLLVDFTFVVFSIWLFDESIISSAFIKLVLKKLIMKANKINVNFINLSIFLKIISVFKIARLLKPN